MSRVVITSPVTVSGQAYKRGDVVEASAALVTALGSNARAASSSAGGRSPSKDDTGEPFGVSNGAP
jgi:hypothetical protein